VSGRQRHARLGNRLEGLALQGRKTEYLSSQVPGFLGPSDYGAEASQEKLFWTYKIHKYRVTLKKYPGAAKRCPAGARPGVYHPPFFSARRLRPSIAQPYPPV
jgi:hypothetical protein